MVHFQTVKQAHETKLLLVFFKFEDPHENLIFQ
jgi:hypothetical protein